MKLRSGKKYETADGVVYRVRGMNYGFFDESDVTNLTWRPDGSGLCNVDLIRRHYTKPQPAHKLDLKPGDVVELVAWEDGDDIYVGKTLKYDETEMLISMPKGESPLFRVVSRASWTKPTS